MRKLKGTAVIGVIVLNSLVLAAPGATISGHAYYAGTTIPLSGVLVEIDGITSTTGANGQYLLPGVPVGWQTITATKSSFDNYSESINVPEQGLTKNIEMTAQNPGTLSGTIYDGQDPPQILTGVTVCVLNPDGSSSNLIDTTDFTGHYQIGNVPPQGINVRFSKPLYDTKVVTIAMGAFDKTYNDQLLMSAIDPPLDFSIATEGLLTSLSWTERPEPTLEGYNLYRSAQPYSGFVKVNASLLPAGTNEYEDTVPGDGAYYYRITSVNNEDREGPPFSYHSGLITSDVTLSGIIGVQGDITVNSGVTLTISPGTRLQFHEDTGLHVNGVLDAQGTQENRITFTSDIHFSSSEPSAGDWAGIVFHDKSVDASCIITYSTIVYAVTGIQCDKSSPTISKCTISENSAIQGAGILCTIYASPTISDCTISANTASYRGGGIYCYYASPSITGCTISGNTAYQGGGIFCDTDSDATIFGCTISQNTAARDYNGYGGGIACEEAQAEITNCTIVENTSDYAGGGIYCGQLPSATITGCIIAENEAARGAGVSSWGSAPAISACTIAANAGYHGGGVYCLSGLPRITNCVIYQNSADVGGGIFCNDSPVTITNCTIAGNTCNYTDGGGIHNSGWDASPTITNCILWGNSADLFQCSASYSCTEDLEPGEGNVFLDPLFVDPDGPDNDSGTWADSDYSLSAGSPSIDAANGGVAPATDILGHPRHDDPGVDNTGVGAPDYVDMGAYEFQGTSVIVSYLEIAGDADVNENSGAQYTCTAHYTDGSTEDVSGSATWSENSDYASVSSGYLSTSSVSSDQPCQITATYEGKSDTHDVTIKDVPVVTSLEISGPTEVGESSGAQYTCNAHYDNGSTTEVTDVASWSENSDYAGIGSNGYLTTSAVDADQPCRITATYESESATYDITVKASPLFLSCDMNWDAFVSIIGDVPGFVQVVYFQDYDGYGQQFPGKDPVLPGDCNGDGILSIVGDVPCFVDCVYFGNCP